MYRFSEFRLNPIAGLTDAGRVVVTRYPRSCQIEYGRNADTVLSEDPFQHGSNRRDTRSDLLDSDLPIRGFQGSGPGEHGHPIRPFPVTS